MKHRSNAPYLPPQEPSQLPITDSTHVNYRRANIALAVSAAAIAMPIVVAALATYHVFSVHQNSLLVAVATTAGTIVLGLTGLVLSIAARNEDRTRKAMVAILLSLAAFPLALLAAWWLCMVALMTTPT